MRETYEETMKRLSATEKDSAYWRHSASRHAQELERAEERAQQAELAGSMKAEAINDAPIDVMRWEIEKEDFDQMQLADMRITLMDGIEMIEEAIDDYINDETPIRISTILSLKDKLYWVMDAQEKLGK